MTSMPYGVQVCFSIAVYGNINYYTKKKFFAVFLRERTFYLFQELAFSNALDAQHTKVDSLATASIIKEEDARLTSRNESVEGNVFRCYIRYSNNSKQSTNR